MPREVSTEPQDPQPAGIDAAPAFDLPSSCGAEPIPVTIHAWDPFGRTHAEAGDLVTALAKEWPGGARFAAHAPAAAVDAGGEAFARTGPDAFVGTPGNPTRMTVLVGVLDARVEKFYGEAEERWRAEQRPRLEACGLAYYETQGGYLVLAALTEPFPIASHADEQAWKARHHAWCIAMREAYGLDLRGAAHFAHPHALPSVPDPLRFGRSPKVFGEIRRIPLPEAAAVAVQPQRPRARRSAPHQAKRTAASAATQATEALTNGAGTAEHAAPEQPQRAKALTNGAGPAEPAAPAPPQVRSEAPSPSSAASPAPAFVFTLYPSKMAVAKGVIRTFESWHEFTSAVSGLLAKTRPGKGGLPYLAPHVRKAGATRRRDQDVDRVTLAILDLDVPYEDAANRATEQGLAVLVYESPSAAPDKPRARLIFPVSRPMLPDECWKVRAALAEMLGLAPGCGVEACLNPHIGFFVGRLERTPAREWWAAEGAPVDVDGLLGRTLEHVWRKGRKRRARKDTKPRDGKAAEQHNVDPVVTDSVLRLHRAMVDRWLAGDREADNFEKSFYGWLLGKHWSRGEVVALVDALDLDEPDAAKRAEHARKVRGTLTVLDGPADSVRAWFGADFPAVDAIVNERSLRAFGRLGSGTGEVAPEVLTEQPPEPERAADLGSARRLVRLHGHKLRHCSARDVWLFWDGSRWADDETGEAMRLAKQSAESLWAEVPGAEDRKAAAGFAVQSQNAGRLEAAVKLAKTEPGVAVRVADLDADPWLLNVQNGTLDLRTGKLRAPDPALLMTKRCAAEYVPGASSELWDHFVARTFGRDAELTSYVQRALGYALFGAWREKAFWFGYGPADGAKSTFFGVVGTVLGDYATTAMASTWMVQSNAGGNRGDLVRLLGARLVTTSEIREGAKVDEEMVKRITGGDPIVAAAKYEGDIQFRPTFALWWFANDPPFIRDDDGAMWSRARVVPFTNVVPKAEQITDLAEQLASSEHAPAVLAWLVAGCLAWQREGLGTCAAVDQATNGYRNQMSRLAGFVESRLEITRDPADVVRNSTVRRLYQGWCAATNVRAPLTPKQFAQRLRLLGVTGGDDKSKREFRFKSPGTSEEKVERDRCWFGVRLREED